MFNLRTLIEKTLPWLRYAGFGAAIGFGLAAIGWTLLWMGALPDAAIRYPPLFPGFHISFFMIHGLEGPFVRDAILISFAFDVLVGALIALAARATFVYPKERRTRRRNRNNQCVACGYELHGLENRPCPECGSYVSR